MNLISHLNVSSLLLDDLHKHVAPEALDDELHIEDKYVFYGV